MTRTNVQSRAFMNDLVGVRIDPDARGWFDRTLESVGSDGDSPGVDSLLRSYSSFARKFPRTPLELDDEESRRFVVLFDAPVPEGWETADAGRAALLLALAESVAPDVFERLALECYWKGDSREQQSWLRALALLPDPGRFANAAMDACRTNIIPLFESIACNNSYPAAFFPDLNFNQMVLKALFNVVRLDRIVGLERRLNPELSRMANDYASEREAAGRELPNDIWLAAVPHAERDGIERAVRYLASDDARHRLFAARAFGLRGDGAGWDALRDRTSVEQDDAVLEALNSSLARIGSGRSAGSAETTSFGREAEDVVEDGNGSRSASSPSGEPK